MKVERLDQRATRYWNRVRCSEMLPHQYVTDKPYCRCKRNAAYLVNGKPYCIQHGGHLALEYLCKLTVKEK